METLGGPCCWGALDGVTVVLVVVFAVPDDVPVCDEVLGTGWGGGTVEGDGMLDPPWGADVAGAELGGGTCDSGGWGGTVCWDDEL